MRNAKLGAQKYVGSRSRTCASPAAETVHDETNPSEVIGSSSSGSRTASSASRRSPAPTATVEELMPLDRLRAGLAEYLVRARRAGSLELGRHVDVVQLGRVQAHDLLLALGAQPREVRELSIVRHLPVD